jgi:hypothetical protein
MAARDELQALGLDGITDMVPTWRSLTVHFDPLRLPHDRLRQALLQAAEQKSALATRRSATPTIVPVCFRRRVRAGPGRGRGSHRPQRRRVITALCALDLHVALIGFLPGFPYLGGLPDWLDLPRRATPRTAVPANSLPSPAARPPSTPGRARAAGTCSGARRSRCSIRPTPSGRHASRPATCCASRPSRPTNFRACASIRAMLEILACPFPASLQDAGRPGYRHLGVPLSGALDPEWLALANALAGNPPDAAAIEMRLAGPRLQSDADALFAIAGDVDARIVGEAGTHAVAAVAQPSPARRGGTAHRCRAQRRRLPRRSPAVSRDAVNWAAVRATSVPTSAARSVPATLKVGAGGTPIPRRLGVRRRPAAARSA